MNERRQPRSNDLLEALPSDDLASLRAHATVVELVANNVLYEAGAVVDCVYFPIDSQVSLLVVVPNGAVVEAGYSARKARSAPSAVDPSGRRLPAPS